MAYFQPVPNGASRVSVGGVFHDIPNYFAAPGNIETAQKTVFSKPVNDFINQANDFARVTLGKEPKFEKYRDSGSRWNPLSENCCIPFHKINLVLLLGGWGSTVVINNGQQNQRQDHTVKLVISGILLALGAAFSTGLHFRKNNEAENKLGANDQMFRDIQNWNDSAKMPRLQSIPATNKLGAIATAYRAMLTNQYRRTCWNLAISASILAGGILLALGAVLGAGAVTFTGGSLVVGSLIVLMVRLGMDWGNKSAKLEADNLRSICKEMKKSAKGGHLRTTPAGFHAQTGQVKTFTLDSYKP